MEAEKKGFAILIGVIVVVICAVIGMNYISDDKYFKYENADNLVGLCGLKIGDSKEKVDAYLFKKLNTKPKVYPIKLMYYFEQNQGLYNDNFKIKDCYNILDKRFDEEELEKIRKGNINDGKIINIIYKDNYWKTTNGLNLIIYDVYGLKIKDYELSGLRLIFYNNKLLQIEVNQNYLGYKLFRAKYGEHNNIKNNNIIAKNINDTFDAKLEIFDRELLEQYEDELEIKSELNQQLENRKLLKEYSEY